MRYVFVLLFWLPMLAEAQKLKLNEPDAETGRQRLESFPVNLKTAENMQMDVSLRAAGDSFFLQLTGTGAGTVNINDPVIFLLDNDSTVTIRSTRLQDYENKASGAAYRHEYPILQEDLEYLSRHNLQGVRKYSLQGFVDIFPDAKNASNLRMLSSTFLQELDRAQLLKTKPVMPSFPGGNAVWLAFLNRNLQPLPPLASGEKKTAVVQLELEADGSILRIGIVQSAGFDFDNELLRILSRMPRWKPALDRGNKVKATVRQQLEFYQEGTKISLRIS
jgi:hypothetical protein